MHTQPCLKNNSTGSANFPARQTAVYLLQVDKAFPTMAEKYALYGHALNRSKSLDGVLSHHVERWLCIPDIHALEQFLAQIGGVQ